jgi:tetratricopeptide (TPR) repeat protein
VSRAEKKKAGKKALEKKAPEKNAPSAASTARGRLLRILGVLGLGALLAGLALWAGAGCSGWDPRSPFERRSPEVDKALEDLDAGQLQSAEEALEKYLGTGACGDGGIGLPDTVRQKPNGAFDLGLTLFYLGERFGHRFGDEESTDGGEPGEAQQAAQRGAEIDCALVIVRALASDPKVPAELRARAYYLAGNLEFLRKKYEDAVKFYDQALAIVPGLFEEAGGDGIGRDAAWNRAIALRRIEDQKDAGNDASPDASPDAADGSDGDDGSDGSDAADASDGNDAADGSDGDAGDDGGKDGGEDGGNKDGGDPDSGKGDAGNEDGGKGDAGSDDASAPKPEQHRAKPEESPAPQQDERMLDQLEEAPTYQEQEAKARAGVRRGRGMEDK